MMRLPWVLLLVTAGWGCGARERFVIDAFPTDAEASPWVLQDRVWSGTFEEAAAGLGDEAAQWRRFGPRHAWLAIYCHDTRPDWCLTLRCFSLESSDAARQAYQALRPAGAEDIAPFRTGDQVCETETGIMLQRGSLVLEIFGDQSSISIQMQSAYLATLVAGKLPLMYGEGPQ